MAEPKQARQTAAGPLKTWIIVIALAAIALLPRLSAAWQGFITPDEPFWVFSSIRFLRALETHHWADTLQIGHPGVTTMWVGTLSVLWQRWRDASAAAAHLAWVAPVPWIAPENAALFPHLAPFLKPARVIAALINTLGVIGIYALARRLFDRRVALLGAALIALDPFTIALSGLLHVDALATTFVTLGLLAWLIALQEHDRSPWRRCLFAALSGLCAGLAALSKSPAIFIAVIVLLSAIAAFLLRRPSRRALKTIALLILVWSLALAAAVLAAFPGMWQDPIGMLRSIYDLAGRYQDEAHEITFFRGHSGGDPGAWFYPTALAFRLTPPTLIGLLFSILPLLLDWRSPQANKRRASMTTLLLFIVGFTFFINFGAKKFDRYLLPTFPSLNLLAAAGWIAVIDPLRRILKRWPFASNRVWPALALILLVAQAAMIGSGWPYYFDVYNPLAGGMKTALRTLPSGWGEGQEQIAAYLNALPQAGKRTVAGASPVTMGTLFEGRVLMLNETSRLLADHILITALDRQIAPRRVAAFTAGATLEHVVRAGGQPILWLYQTQYTAEAEHLKQYGAPGDALLCDARTPFARRPGVYVLDDAGPDKIAASLNDWSAAHTRLWYFSYPIASPITAQQIRRQLDTFAARLDEVDLGYATAALYILPGDPAFVARPAPFLPAHFGALTLQGAAQLDREIAADGVVRFVLRWQAQTAPNADYAPFIHLIDAAGHLRAAGRGDDLLVDDRYWPTSVWQPGDQAELPYSLGLPPGLPPGQYQIHVGLSNAASGDWLPVLDEQGRIKSAIAPALTVDILPATTPPTPDQLTLPYPASVTWRNQLKLFGVDHPSTVNVGETAVIGIGWLGLGRFGEAYRIRLSLVDPDSATVQQQTFSLSQYPTTAWRRGELLYELYDLELRGEIEGGQYALEIQVLDAAGVPLSPPVEIGALTVSAPNRLFALPAPPQHSLDLRLGDSLSLIGYDLPQTEIAAGQPLSLTLYWRCEAPPADNYVVFVHLVDSQGRIQSQVDRQPANGRAPTSGWVEGQIIVDEYALSIDPDTPAGLFQIQVGMYDARTMIRLPMLDENGQHQPDDRALLPDGVDLD